MPLYEFDGKSPSLPEDGSAWIAPSADIIGDARLGNDVGVWFRAVVRADNTPIIVGDRTNVQDGVMLHSDPDAPLTIGRDCTIGHHAILHGCTIGDNVLIGMGATILNGAVIADNCIVGANALVTEGKHFPPRSLIVGAPARAVRELDDTSPDMVSASAAEYVERQKRFAANLRRID